MRREAKVKSGTPAEPAAAKARERGGKRVYFSQADFPLTTLQEAQRVASALSDDFGGTAGSPPDVALSLSISPTSSAWRTLTGSSIAYGLTEGGYSSATITLTPLGKKLVAPEEEGADTAARLEAILRPRILKEFFEKYRRAKFPSDVIGCNVLKSLGVPPERASEAIGIVKANGTYAGIIRDTPTGPFVNLDSPSIPKPATTPIEKIEDKDASDGGANATEFTSSGPTPAAIRPLPATEAEGKTDRVFISHGKQKAIVEQIKELLAFGHFDPVVSVERESTAIPVPEKVFEDMRSCGAGVIHVTAEGKFLDPDGKEHVRINDNVLIEIGAAMALYGKKVILLVQKGVPLPSNLQGL